MSTVMLINGQYFSPFRQPKVIYLNLIWKLISIHCASTQIQKQSTDITTSGLVHIYPTVQHFTIEISGRFMKSGLVASSVLNISCNWHKLSIILTSYIFFCEAFQFYTLKKKGNKVKTLAFLWPLCAMLHIVPRSKYKYRFLLVNGKFCRTDTVQFCH